MLEQRLAEVWRRGRPGVMGILNVTPDSFADGGRFVVPEQAVRHGLSLLDAGADVVDVGGESTRPGARPVPAQIELERVVPVVAELARHRPGAIISVDTTKAEVAEAALGAGATIVNDVTAGRDPAMLAAVARHSAGIVLMHMRGSPSMMQRDTSYVDVVAEVHGFLAVRAAEARAAAIPRDRILLDPGIGFGKDAVGNLRLLAALPDLSSLGHALVIGASRKSFIGAVAGAGVEERLAGSLAAIADTVGLPCVLVRVHDVAAAVQFLTVLSAVRGAA
ncbi:MAG TPA: dihydropteroate synthase [Thermoanaerobaculaceae bacterium]|nr:dihydropteroate synthase [Thermoanaerobaculaceae bacterium]